MFAPLLGAKDLSPETLQGLQNLEEGDHDFDGAKNPLTVKELQGLNDNVEAKESEIEAKADSKPEAANTDFAHMSDDDKLNYYLDQMREQMAQPKGNEGKQKDKSAPAQELPDVAKVGPLSVEQRLSFITSQMKIGIEAWWNENKGWVIPTVIGVILGVTALIVVTGGAAIMPVLSALMQGLTVIFGAMLVAQIAAPLKDYIVKAWNGDKKGASQSLAQAFAVGLTEIIFNLIFKGLGKLFKLIGKGAKAAMRGMKKLAQSTVRLTKRLGTALLRNGKVIFQGLKKGALKGSKSVGGMVNKLARRFRFKRIIIKRTKQRIDVYGEFNPKVLILTFLFGRVVNHKFGNLSTRLRQEFALTSKSGRPKEIGALNSEGNKIIVTDDFAEEFAKLSNKEQSNYLKRLRKADTQAEREGIIKEVGGNKEPAWFSDPTIPESAKNVAKKRGDLRKNLKTPDGDEGHHAFSISNLGKSKTLQDAVESGFGYNTGKNGVNLSKFSSRLGLDGVHASHPHYSAETLKLAEKFNKIYGSRKGYTELHAEFFTEAMAKKLIDTIEKICVKKGIKVDDLFKTGKGMGNIDPNKLYNQVIKSLSKQNMLPKK